jgi:hypothetical protein
MHRGASISPTSHHLAPLALTLALACAAATAADQPMYRCQDGDAVTFSQEPCDADAREIDVHYDAPTPAAAAAADASLQAEEAGAGQAAATTARRQQIEATERSIEHLRTERDRAVTELGAQRQHGTEARADDTYRERKTGEMKTVIDQYDTRIEAAEAELRQLLQQ